MAHIRASEGQTLADIAARELGSPEAAFEIAVLNDLQVDENLLPGQIIELPAVVNADIAEYYKNKNFRPATQLTDEQDHDKIFDYVFDYVFE